MKLQCFICWNKFKRLDSLGFEFESYAQYELEEHLRTHTIDEIISGMARMHWSLGLGTFEPEYGIKPVRRTKQKHIESKIK